MTAARNAEDARQLGEQRRPPSLARLAGVNPASRRSTCGTSAAGMRAQRGGRGSASRARNGSGSPASRRAARRGHRRCRPGPSAPRRWTSSQGRRPRAVHRWSAGRIRRWSAAALARFCRVRPLASATVPAHDARSSPSTSSARRCARSRSSCSTWRPPAARRTTRRDHRDRRGEGARRRAARRAGHAGRPGHRGAAEHRRAHRHHHRDGHRRAAAARRCCRRCWSSCAARCWSRTTPRSTPGSCAPPASGTGSRGRARRCCARRGSPAPCCRPRRRPACGWARWPSCSAPPPARPTARWPTPGPPSRCCTGCWSGSATSACRACEELLALARDVRAAPARPTASGASARWPSAVPSAPGVYLFRGPARRGALRRHQRRPAAAGAQLLHRGRAAAPGPRHGGAGRAGRHRRLRARAGGARCASCG